MAASRPSRSLPNTMLVATLTGVPAASLPMAAPRISAVMPKRSWSRLRTPSSASVTTARLSSKYTPPTTIEPKPAIVPEEKTALPVPPVPLVSLPPPQPPSANRTAVVRSQQRQ